MRSVVSFTLRNYGYDVREAATGSEALSQIQTRTPDAMLLDLGLPDIDGFVVTACRPARARVSDHRLVRAR